MSYKTTLRSVHIFANAKTSHNSNFNSIKTKNESEDDLNEYQKIERGYQRFTR